MGYWTRDQSADTSLWHFWYRVADRFGHVLGLHPFVLTLASEENTWKCSYATSTTIPTRYSGGGLHNQLRLGHPILPTITLCLPTTLRSPNHHSMPTLCSPPPHYHPLLTTTTPPSPYHPLLTTTPPSHYHPLLTHLPSVSVFSGS